MKTIILLLLCVPAWAQLPVVNQGVMTISTNTTVSVNGSFTNEGMLVNNGILLVSGEWLNPGVYDVANGQVTFNSNDTQVINHNAQSFQRVTISGGGKKIFNADIQIAGELRLLNGILESSNQSKIVIGRDGRVTGGSPQSFIQGQLYHTGTGNKFYPIGTNGRYLPVSLPNIGGVDPVVGLQVFEPNTFTERPVDLEAVSEKRYWRLTVANGTFDGSIAVLPLLDEDFSADISRLVVVQSNGTSPFESLGQSLSGGDLQSGFVTSAERVTLPIMTIGAIDENPERVTTVYNAVTPNGDQKHDFLKIENLEFFPGNRVTIVNRWGERVFEIQDYNNADKVFSGNGNVGGNRQLADGTYFYVIDKGNGDKKINGYFILSR